MGLQPTRQALINAEMLAIAGCNFIYRPLSQNKIYLEKLQALQLIVSHFAAEIDLIG